jgi:hypothetical protein
MASGRRIRAARPAFCASVAVKKLPESADTGTIELADMSGS